MAKIPVDVILIWAGTHAAIPAGFTRETALDGKFPKGANGSNQNTPGGAATHTHSSPSHTHGLASHTHTYTISGITGFFDENLDSEVSTAIAQQNHTHTGTTGASTAGTTAGTAVTYGAASNNPPYYDVIFIKSQGAGLQNDVIALFNSASLPSNWQECTGAASSPDLRNKYLRGAATSANAGTTGGSTTNVHDISHAHSANMHNHGSTTSSTVTNQLFDEDGGGDMVINHSHTFTPGDTAVPVTDYSGSLTTAETVEPLYKKLVAIQRKTGGLQALGIIGLWLGATANIPLGWKLCDGNNGTPNMTDYHLKITNTTAELGNTGGSNTHTHAAQSHAHSASSHSHSIPELTHPAGTKTEGGGQAFDGLRAWQNHPVQSTDATTATYSAANTTADSSNNEPAYLTAHFIQYQKDIVGGAAMMALF